MNEVLSRTTCPRCKNGYSVTEGNRGYCPICYPFPRVYCRGCDQPLTSEKHRSRGVGARCYAKERERLALLDTIAREHVPFVESGGKGYRRRRHQMTDKLEELF